MSRTLRFAIGTGVLAALTVVPAVLRAQATPRTTRSAAADSLAFPRQFVKWVLSSQGDSAFAHAGPELQQRMESATGINEMSARIKTRFGEQQGTDAEVQFDDGAQKVYIVVLRYAQAPEPAAWVVAYVPSTKVVQSAGFAPLSSVKTRYPQAKLP